ncbi:MAG: TraY domain-containing protein [Acidobacteria bacterium]|nr:TraY domain-containing protein [Acidobacteriota bacterium]
MLSIRLDHDTERRLEALAVRTGRTKSYYARKAIVESLAEWEDIAEAIQRLEEPGKRMSMREVERILDLDD